MASIFSSVALTHEQVAQTLASAFTLDADPMGLGWVVIAAPGRTVIVEPATEDLPAFPDSILRRATQNLGGKPPVWCLSAIFAAGALRGGGWRQVTDPDTGKRHGVVIPKQVFKDPDLEFNTAVLVGAVLARTWPIAMDDHAGVGWQQEPWLPGTDPGLVLARPHKLRSRPSRTAAHTGHSYEPSPPAYPVARPVAERRSGSALQWAWHHKYLTGLGFMGTGALFALVHALYGLGFLLFLIGAAPFGLKFLKWGLFLIFLGGPPPDSPDDKPWKKDRYGKRQ